MLEIIAPTGEVFPYLDIAKAYLQAGEGALVDDYFLHPNNPQIPVQIEWEYAPKNGEFARKFVVEYATKDDFSDAISVETDGGKRSLGVYDLYKASDYFVRITALDGDGNVLEKVQSTFYTTALGPRVINVEGTYNVRDVGGFETLFGKRIVQGIAYRGGALVPDTTWGIPTNATETGRRVLDTKLGIRAELDFRNPKESGLGEGAGSLLRGVKLTYITSDGYDKIFEAGYAEAYRKVFSYLSDKDNYPLYCHCTAGADRTGTVVYLLHALLGVSPLECLQDYEFTSFSFFGLRGGKKGDNVERLKKMFTILDGYPGGNLQQKTETYLLSIGVTAEEIANIKGIFLGEIAVADGGRSR